MDQVYLVCRNRVIDNIHEYNVYVDQAQGYQGLQKALEMSRDEVTAIVKASNLRGRGGAGFPTGVKWGFMPKNVTDGPVYLLVNCAEGEPGTFGNHEVIERNPQQLIEGIIIACYAIGATAAYIYHRGEFKFAAERMQQAVDDAYAHGWLGEKVAGRDDFRLDIYLHPEASAYICGEETAQLNSLEGYLGQPRLKPPFPAQAGLWKRPTTVNNVETLAHVPLIVLNGADWFKQYGSEDSAGTRVYCVSGHVNRPGNYELPMNVTARELIFEHCGGIWKGRSLKGFIPGGVSAPVLTEEHLDLPLDYGSMAKAGSMGGSGGVIVLDDQTDMAWLSTKMVDFYAHESCGKCSPCREGTYWQQNLLHRMMRGEAREGDVEMLELVSEQMAGKCFCPLGESSQMVVLGAMKYFRDDFEAYGSGKAYDGVIPMRELVTIH
ncbi:MAG: NADH-quinone oxidoreductase subunit NuoF [Anaerolineales bacterium]|nr:NADH-quinone oxidoreductase subunit NuoF [Anaerolineales bacterium]MCB9128748.1 NADH-quinone oxidoreductase subunit NuoF [Ardenticatenales bacterium]